MTAADAYVDRDAYVAMLDGAAGKTAEAWLSLLNRTWQAVTYADTAMTYQVFGVDDLQRDGRMRGAINACVRGAGR